VQFIVSGKVEFAF